MNLKVENFEDREKDILKYLEKNGEPGRSMGFKCMDEFYTIKDNGVTDWTGHASCFTKEQGVVTDKGVVPISEIKIGDNVFCYNESADKNEFKKVVDTIPNHNNKQRLLKIKMKDGSIIRVTENHLFYHNGEYKKIKDLLGI